MQPLTVHIPLVMSSAMGRGVVEGIARYADRRRDWQFRNAAPDAERSGGDLGPKTGDAILGVIRPEVLRRWRGKRRRRVVNVSRRRDIPGAANVTCDDRLISRLAAEHLLEKDIEHFAFVGDSGSGSRCDAFVEALDARARDCDVYIHPDPGQPMGDALDEWLASLPKPCGLMAFSDGFASDVIGRALKLGIPVPQDLAVIGVDNDTFLSLLSPIPITSVDPDFASIGWRAAEVLDGVLAGKDPPDEPIRIPPRRVVERQSTDFPNETDQLAVRAARLIRQRACDGVSVAEVVDALPVTQRSLERRFRRVFGHTLRDEIIRARMTEARRLLADTRMPVADVAARTGFSDAKHFSTMFRKTHGLPPSHYRQQQGVQIRV